MKKIKVAALVALCVFLLSVPAGRADRSVADGNLVILFTHDLHSYLLPERLPASAGPSSTTGGIAKLASLIEKYRTIHGDKTLVLDGGDFAMGTLFHTSFATNGLELHLLGKLGYDVTTLGNHEFDFHPAGLAGMLNAAQQGGASLPAVVASNTVLGPPGGQDAALRQAFQNFPVREYTVLEKNGLRVGVFGLMGKDAQTDAPFASPVTFADPVATAARMVDILRNKEKVDIVICLSHSGTRADKRLSEDEILPTKVPGIDVIVSGHTHIALPRPIVVGKTIVVSSGCCGAYLGVLEIGKVEEQGAKVVSYKLITVSEKIPDDPEIATFVNSLKSTVEQEYLSRYGLSFDQPLADIAFDMESLLYAHEHPGETGLGNMITDAYRYAIEKAEGDHYDYIHVVVEPLGNIRSSLVQGSVTVADLFRVLSLGYGTDGTPGYPLLTTYITGKELKKLMEVETTISHMKDDAHLQVSGIKCIYNPHRMPFDRVTSITVREKDGTYRPVDPRRLYRVAMNHYTAMMVQYVGKVSFGLLTFSPKDQEGRPMADLSQGIVPAGSLFPGVRQIKEWAALAAYVGTFPDTDGNGLPNVPDRYKGPEGRLVSQPSWNPINLIAGGSFVTYGALAALVAVIAIIVLVIWFIARFARRRLGKKYARGRW